MKKALLIVLMALMLVIPAYAAEGDLATDQPIQQEQEPVVVASLEELQVAIDAAEDGNIIYISDTISVSDVEIKTDKHITLARTNGFYGGMFRVKGGTIISGFEFIDNTNCDSSGALIQIIGAENETIVCQCNFYYSGNGLVSFIDVTGGILDASAKIEHCSFYGATNAAISSKSGTNVLIDSSVFDGNSNYLPGGAISCSGDLLIKNSIIINGTAVSGGGIFNSGSLTISNCQIYGNDVTNSKFGRDIFSIGTLAMTDFGKDNGEYYEESTGEKIVLPLVDCKQTAKLIYLTEEQAIEYFAPEPPITEPEQPNPGNDDNNGEDTPPEHPQPPQQPGDQTGDDDTTGGEQPPQKPAQPSEGEGKDDPTDNPDSGDQNTPQQPEQPPQGGNEDEPTDTPPQTPEQPEEPPQGDTTDKPADTTPDTPQQPQEPADGDNGNNDNYTPPTDYRPSQRPIWPIVTVKPTEDNKPQDQPDNNPAPAKPQLACNGAVIDTSRTVVLLGYGDGLIHENDPLTRAQLATIVYRLLDDESIAKYNNAQVTFADVAADAWYAPYVRVIQAAGIVNGVGDGKYDPNGVVTWAQIITILTRFVEPQKCTLQHNQYNGWATQAIQTAVANGWIKDSITFSPDAVISRGQLEQLVNRVLELYRV